MHRTTSRNVIVMVFALYAVAFFGCSNTQSPDISGNNPGVNLDAATRSGRAAALDQELRELLISHAQGRGLNHFRFPLTHQLGDIPQDPRNPLTPQKVRLGMFLYHEAALGVDNVRPEGRETYSCASCHHAQGGFMANRAQGVGEGGTGFGIAGESRDFLPQYASQSEFPDCQPIRTPTALNTAYQELMLWNGQFGGLGDNLGTEPKWQDGTPLASNHLGLHGLETQAHAGLSVHRMGSVDFSRVAELRGYRHLFRAAFPRNAAPITLLNAALAIAAYERTLLATEAPFQKWLRGRSGAMTKEHKRGAIVFFGKGDCVACHTGPAMSSMSFHALGMSDLDGAYDAAAVNLNPFDGTVPADVRLGRGGFTGRDADMYTFKTPQLYNLVDSPFYGHGASFATVREVLEYKNNAVPENALVPVSRISTHFRPLQLSAEELDDLTVFIEEALYDPDLRRFLPRALPSGNCFPVNDPESQADLGCEAEVVAAGH